MSNAKQLSEVTYLRVFAIISLVAWHSYCSYICWELADSPLDILYTQIFRVIAPTANMPLFTFLSGYLFCYLFVYNYKYQEFKPFLINKMHRLLIPYLVLGLIINMTQLQRMNPLELFWGTPCHLWYCLMLFYCFIICWAVEKYLGRLWNYVLAIASFGFVIYWGGQFLSHSPFGICLPAYYYCYFYLGFIVYKHKDRAICFVDKYYPLHIIVWLLTLFFPLEGHSQGVTSVCFVLLILTIASKVKAEPSSSVKTLSKYSFGIFVFHQWIIWNVTIYGRISPFMNEHYVLFPLLLLCVFTLSTLLTHFALKTKVGRYLLT